jgi:ribonuclease Z
LNNLNHFPEIFDLKTQSVAGEYSFYYFKPWRTLLDCGVYHPCFTGVRNIILTHAHMDHFGGLFQIIARKNLLNHAPPKIFGAPWIYPDFKRILQTFEKLNQSPGWGYEWQNLEPGKEFSLGGGRILKVSLGFHRQENLCVQIFDRRRRLQTKLKGSPSTEIRSRLSQGQEITEVYDHPLIFYTGDSDRRVLQTPRISAFENLILESTFFGPEHREKAYQTGHTHFEEILEAAPNFQCKTLLLTHFSARYSKTQIQNFAKTLKPELKENCKLFLNL